MQRLDAFTFTEVLTIMKIIKKIQQIEKYCQSYCKKYHSQIINKIFISSFNESDLKDEIDLTSYVSNRTYS